MASPSLDSTKKPAGLLSPTVVNLQIAGWLVFICLWLPLCKGCNGGVDKTPIDFLEPFTINQLGDLFSDFLIVGLYCNGVLNAMAMAMIAWFVSERLWRSIFYAQFVLTLAVCVIFVSMTFYHSSDGKSLLEDFLVTVPTLVAFTIWVGQAIRRKNLPRAWARLQHAWTIAALFLVHMMVLFEGSVLFGYWITMIGQGGLFVAVEVAVYRMKHDLWDVSQKVTRPQFSILNILLWTAFFPLAFTYFRSIGPICNWVFAR